MWRDEDGTAIVPAMSGDTDDRMAEAIEASSFIIICISPAYKNSANCRIEAKYSAARSKKGLLKIIYVMMDKDYTTHSSPRCIDGWLALMVGEDLWCLTFLLYTSMK